MKNILEIKNVSKTFCARPSKPSRPSANSDAPNVLSSDSQTNDTSKEFLPFGAAVADRQRTFSTSASDKQRTICALRDVSFSIRQGSCTGLVGESGCGKSTLARAICRFINIDSGEIWIDGQNIVPLKKKDLAPIYNKVQMVFQDSTSSFDPRKTLGAGICERMIISGTSKNEAYAIACELAQKCGLEPALLDRYPREVSGGQCQRAAIARALAANPSLLICDEATSALDATTQHQIVQLLASLRDSQDISILFISHDLALVSNICSNMVVMKSAQIVEDGTVQQVINNPQSSYTQQLLSAAL